MGSATITGGGRTTVWVVWTGAGNGASGAGGAVGTDGADTGAGAEGDLKGPDEVTTALELKTAALRGPDEQPVNPCKSKASAAIQASFQTFNTHGILVTPGLTASPLIS